MPPPPSFTALAKFEWEAVTVAVMEEPACARMSVAVPRAIVLFRLSVRLPIFASAATALPPVPLEISVSLSKFISADVDNEVASAAAASSPLAQHSESIIKPPVKHATAFALELSAITWLIVAPLPVLRTTVGLLALSTTSTLLSVLPPINSNA